MKNKKLFAILTLVCFMFTLMPVAAFADTQDTVVLKIGSADVYKNGEKMTTDVAPTIVDGRTLVPVRVIIEAMDGTVDWDETTRTVTITIDGKVLKLVIDKEIAGFGTGAKIIESRTMVPIRYISEYVGFEVKWVESTQQVIITRAADEAAETCTVSFDLNTGNEGVYKTVTVEKGKTVEKPDVEYKSGRVFHGWYTNDEGKGDAFDFSTPIYSDMTLYGHWGTVSYGGGGSSTPSTPSHSHNFGNWVSNDDGTHSINCTCGEQDIDICIFTGENAKCECGANLETVVANAETVYVASVNALQTALTNGGNIVLANNITLNEDDLSLTIPAGVTVTLNLNGRVISQTKSCIDHYEMIKNNGTLIVSDSEDGGEISFTDNGTGDSNFGWGSYTIGNYGTLIVESGTIENLSAQNPISGTVVHMYCAIHQGWGAESTTINGGKISNPTYRSIRINNGTLTINGGEMDGQVWMHPFDDNTSITINGGSFHPNGVDGSSVYIENSEHDVAMSVTGGSFETKIGCSDANKLAGVIFGGEFTDAAKNGTNEKLFAKEVSNATDLKEALVSGNNVVLTSDIKDLDADETIEIPTGKAVTLNLNGHTLSGTADGTGNREMFLVKGDMTIENGTIELTATQNQGWNAMATVFDVTAGGKLNIKDVDIKVSGTDMTFCVHLNNWGEVTLNVANSTLTANYCAVRVFNSGFDMNNVTVKNSTLHGDNRAFMVHNYIGDLDSSKHSDEAIKARLNIDLINGTNIITNGTAENPKNNPIRYGFSSQAIYYDANGNDVTIR